MEEEKRRQRRKIVLFLKEYKIICEKHKLIVSGCGCCHSPSLTDLVQNEKDFHHPIEETLDDNLSHLLETGL